jgi:hypothetical protein
MVIEVASIICVTLLNGTPTFTVSLASLIAEGAGDPTDGIVRGLMEPLRQATRSPSLLHLSRLEVGPGQGVMKGVYNGGIKGVYREYRGGIPLHLNLTVRSQGTCVPISKAPTHNKRSGVWVWANGMNGPGYTGPNS